MTFTPPVVFAPGQPGFSSNLNNTVAALAAYTDALTAPVVAPTNRMWLDFFRMAMDTTPVFTSYTTTANRFKYVLMNVWERTHLANLKAANPAVRGRAYQNMLYAVNLVNAANGFQSDCSTAISIEEGNAAGSTPDWYARNGVNVIANPSGGGSLIRLNLPEVQAAWVSNVITRAMSGTTKWDGIFADDCNYDVPTMTAPFTTDDTFWRGAVRPHMLAAYPALRANSLLLVPNFGSAGEHDNQSDVFPYVDGYCDEFYMRYDGGSWNGYWYNAVLEAEKAVAQGATAFLSTPGSSNTDTTAMRCGLAAALMVVGANPSSVAWHFKGIDHTNEKWDATFDYPIGAPQAGRSWTGTAFASGLIRYFTKGVAVLNPGYNPGAPYGAGTQRTSPASDITVGLVGGPYTGSGRTSVSNVTLVPGEGAILLKD